MVHTNIETWMKEEVWIFFLVHKREGFAWEMHEEVCLYKGMSNGAIEAPKSSSCVIQECEIERKLQVESLCV